MLRVTTTQEEERFTRKQGSKCGEKTQKSNHWAPSSARVPNAANFFGIERRLPFRTLTFSPPHGRTGYIWDENFDQPRAKISSDEENMQLK